MKVVSDLLSLLTTVSHITVNQLSKKRQSNIKERQ